MGELKRIKSINARGVSLTFWEDAEGRELVSLNRSYEKDGKKEYTSFVRKEAFHEIVSQLTDEETGETSPAPQKDDCGCDVLIFDEGNGDSTTMFQPCLHHQEVI